MTSKSTERLTSRFIEGTLAQRDAFQKFDMAAQNRLWRWANEAAEALMKTGPEGRWAVEALLNHASPSVRKAAAARVIQWNPERGVRVLKSS